MRKKSLKIVTCCLAGALLTAVPVYEVEAAPASQYTKTAAENKTDASASVAGVALAVNNYLEDHIANQKASAEAASASDQADASEKSENKNDQTAAKTDKQEAKTEKTKTETKTSKYENMAVAQVNDYVNIRKEPNEDGELLGKLHSNSVATVLKKKGDWYKIKSGSVTGYVKGDYIVVGDTDLIQSVGVDVATVNTTTLKVRSKASKKADVITLVPDGEELAVASMKQYKDGWVKVDIEDGKGYVSADYVDISTQYNYAESKAEEEARLAVEQARREEEERAKAASSGSSSSSSSDSSGSSASSSGQAVVSYASQFLGNPYVWGGSSLTNGADCSGFVMSVYAHFGVSLPHSSGALRGVGYSVSSGSMQPGDIICYDGHVAIYAGGNTVIHASNPATGIKYTSPANYRPILAVRRIF